MSWDCEVYCGIYLLFVFRCCTSTVHCQSVSALLALQSLATTTLLLAGKQSMLDTSLQALSDNDKKGMTIWKQFNKHLSSRFFPFWKGKSGTFFWPMVAINLEKSTVIISWWNIFVWPEHKIKSVSPLFPLIKAVKWKSCSLARHLSDDSDDSVMWLWGRSVDSTFNGNQICCSFCLLFMWTAIAQEVEPVCLSGRLFDRQCPWTRYWTPLCSWWMIHRCVNVCEE